MSDSRRLSQRARDAISAGRIPDKAPESIWGGPGLGVPCPVCGQPVKSEESGFELEFVYPGERSTCEVHVPCFHAWESARANAAAAQEARAGALLREQIRAEKIGGRVDGREFK